MTIFSSTSCIYILKKLLTKSDEAKRLSSDPGCPWCYLADLFYALDSRALPESLVEPGVSPVQVEDVTESWVCCFFYSCWRNITHCNTWKRQSEGRKYRLLYDGNKDTSRPKRNGLHNTVKKVDYNYWSRFKDGFVWSFCFVPKITVSFSKTFT